MNYKSSYLWRKLVNRKNNNLYYEEVTNVKEKFLAKLTLDNLKKVNTIISICSLIGTVGAFLLEGPISDKERAKELENLKQEVIDQMRKES